MDDFLHNLRSGKLKQQDRGRRDYSDYKGPQRRGGNDRRRNDYYTKVTNENFGMVKESLSHLTNAQKHVGDVLSSLDKTGARIADALETLIDLLSAQSDSGEKQNLLSDPIEETLPVVETPDPPLTDQISENVKTSSVKKAKLSDEDKPRMLKIIASMRKDKKSWEKIAQHIDDLNIPTVSGKGKWRGQAIKKFYDTHS